MRFGVEYRNDLTGTIYLCLFHAEDQDKADLFVDDLCITYGYTWIGRLRRIEDGSLAELKRLFPNYDRPQFRDPQERLDGLVTQERHHIKKEEIKFKQQLIRE